MLKRIMYVVAVVSTVMAVARCGSNSNPTTTGTVGTVAPINGVCPTANPIIQPNQQCAAFSQGSYCSGLPGTTLNTQVGYCSGTGTIPQSYYQVAWCGYYTNGSGFGCLPSNSWNNNVNLGSYYGNPSGNYVNYYNGGLSSLSAFGGQRGCGYVASGNGYYFTCSF